MHIAHTTFLLDLFGSNLVNNKEMKFLNILLVGGTLTMFDLLLQSAISIEIVSSIETVELTAKEIKVGYPRGR